MRTLWHALGVCAGGLVLVAGVAEAQQTLGFGSVQGTVVNRETGAPLNYANVIIAGTTMGATATNGGRYKIDNVAIGTYQVKATFIGYDSQTITDVQVEAGQPVQVNFRLKESVGLLVETVTVTGQATQADIKSSGTAHVTTEEKVLTLPVDSVEEAVALNTGVVVQGGELHVRGGRSNEISVRIDGVPVDDPLSGGKVDLGLLSVAQSELISGGMDAEYGNASSAIILYTTKSGGRNFEGNFRYTTDDYGRPDKTFTNYDRVAIGFGGPTPFDELTYYVSGEATFQDGEFLTVKRYEQNEYLGGLVKIKDRADSNFRTQSRLDWKISSGVRMSGEMTLSRSSSDPYVHNWNTEGYVSRIIIFPQLRRNRFTPKFWTPQGQVIMYHGGWLEAARKATYIDLRENFNCTYCLMPISDNVTVRGVRVVDFRGRGSDPNDPVYLLIDFVVFDGYQNPLSEWSPELSGAPGDTNKTYYNAAEHTANNSNTSRQFKWALTHTLSTKTFYEVKLSRLSFDRLLTVNSQTPNEFSSAGQFLWEPGSGPTRVGNVDFYTDPEVPFFVTAYDYPEYIRRNSKTYSLKSDITTQYWEGHSIKGGVFLQYNDLDNAHLGSPGRQRNFGESYGFTRNVFHNFNPEGSFYLQDRWEYEGMVMNAGVRYDFLSPGSGVDILIANNEIRRDVVRWQTQFSPRLGLAFPITDRDAFSFHYGRFIQFPEKALVFASQDVNAGFAVLGNPNLEPETSISYQAAILHQFSNTISGQFALFNKDVFGLVSSVEITDDSTGSQRRRFVNKAYASSRGLEIQLNKSFSRNFAFDLAYTFSFADGVASDADFGQRASGLSHLPTGELPLDWDQRHTVNLTLSVARSGDWLATTVYQYQSGFPWTPFFRFEKKQDPLLENSRRRPATHTVNFRGEKYFKVYGQSLRLFFDGKNLLDEEIILSLEPRVFPGMQNALNGYLPYATETGRFGGAYLFDSDGDGRDEFFPVNDPRVFGQRRLFRIGLGFEF